MVKPREIVKVRKLGQCLIITLPKLILESAHLRAGDRVMIETAKDGKLIISREPEVREGEPC